LTFWFFEFPLKHAMQMEANVMECLGDWESWGSGCPDAMDGLQCTSCFSDSWLPDNIVQVTNKPCALFEVLGTEDTWQGKHFHQICINGRIRGMLNLVRWPMVQILSKLSMSQLGILARTCRTFRKAALRALEEKAQDLLVSRYFQESHLIKFIDAFACFGWAMSLTESLTPATVATWRAEELDAIFEHLVAFIQIEEVSLLHGLQPEAARRWKIEGRQTLELFVADCVTLKASFCKLLMHYDRAWLAIRKIMELNAKLVDGRAVRGQLGCCAPNKSLVADSDGASGGRGSVQAQFRPRHEHLVAGRGVPVVSA
jgi:hypothetical protein